MEDDLRRKTTFDGRRSLTEDDLWRKTQLRRRSDYSHPVAIFSVEFDIFLLWPFPLPFKQLFNDERGRIYGRKKTVVTMGEGLRHLYTLYLQIDWQAAHDNDLFSYKEGCLVSFDSYLNVFVYYLEFLPLPIRFVYVR